MTLHIYKKPHLHNRGMAIAALGVMFASAAIAQTAPVSIYGVLDVGLAVNTNANGQRQTYVATRHESSFWGLRGTEDLGGGNSAMFQFENTVAVDTGAGGVRSSFVGLRSDKFGTVTLGRQYDLMVDHVQSDPARQHSINAVVAGNYDRSLGNYLNNSIKYKSPSFGGVVFGVMYAPGENDPTAAGDATGVNAVYLDGPVRLAATILNVKGVTARPFNDLGIASLYGISFAGSLAKTVVHDQRITAVGGYRDIGNWRVLGNLSYTRLKASTGQTAGYRALSFGAFTPVTQGFKFGIGASSASLGDSRWTSVHAIATYVFSKRTEVYLRGISQVATGPAQKAALFIEGPSSDSRQSVIGAGITHRF